MGNVNWGKTESFYEGKSAIINNNVSSNDWIGYMDALGWMENNGQYGGINAGGYAGMYQVGDAQLTYIDFLNGVGKQFLGVYAKSELANNPLAQDLAAIMEFSGVPKVTTTQYSSVYLAIRSEANRVNELSNAIFDQLIGKTINISFTDAGSETIILTKAGISSAAHLVGVGKMAEILTIIYNQCFSLPDNNGNITQTSSTAIFPTEGFADGNGIAFSTYLKLLQNYDISPLLKASNLTDFNVLAQELMNHRKDKIINGLIAKKQEVAMSVSYGSTDYRETVRSIMQGLNLSTGNLDAVAGQVILAGAADTKYTDNADLIFGLGNGRHTLTGGKGNDTLYGGTGFDTYIYNIGDGNDKIIDTGENEIIIKDNTGNSRTIKNVFKAGTNLYKDATGSITVTHNSPWQIVLEDGNTINLGDADIAAGDFGINLIEVPTNPETTHTILGDLTPVDFDPNTAGIQMHYDDWGNVIVSNTPNSGRNDGLSDTTASDQIAAGDGDDEIISYRGGNDWLLGGNGSDNIKAAARNNILEGNVGNDIIIGGAGSDKVFGEDYGEMSELIAQGDVAPNINQKGDFVTGGGGDDFVYGSNANDALFGGNGNDLMVAGGGDDIIHGDYDFVDADRGWTVSLQVSSSGDGTTYTHTFMNVQWADNASAYTGDDVIYAGAGNDYIDAGGGDDEVYCGSGNDTIFGYAGNDFIEGGNGDDVLCGDEYGHLSLAEHGNDYIDGGGGNDSIYGDGGNDQLFGGSGNDYIAGYFGDDYLDGEDGNDLLFGEAGNDIIFGGDGNDQLYGDASNVVLADQGDDYLDGGAGDDTIWGYGGNDYIDGGDGNNKIYTGDGNNEIHAGSGNDEIEGGGGDDYIDTGDGNNTVHAGNGNNEIYAGNGNDYISGGTGDDYIYAGDGNNTIYAGDGNNEIYAGSGNDHISGGSGDDYIDAGAGNDSLYGNTGDDTYVFVRGYGQDTISDADNSGNLDTILLNSDITPDDVVLSCSGSNLILSINETSDQLTISNFFSTLAFTYQIEQIEFADGTIWNVSEIYRRTYVPGNGNDYLIVGTNDDDSINGSIGNNLIDGGYGADTMIGGTGDDIYYVDNAGDVVVENVNEGTETVISYTTYALSDNLENLILTDTDDINGMGNAADNLIYGNRGANFLSGGAGIDNLYGGSGNDTLDGGSGNDGLRGGAGVNTYIFGRGYGQDMIVGANIMDKIQLHTGITQDNIILRRQWDDLIITINDTSDRLRVYDYFYNYDNASRIDQITFADGSSWDVETVKAKVLLPAAGDNWLYGSDADDSILGGAGNDSLCGGSGNDTLDGVVGNDTLQGGAGADTYIFNVGSGQDTIINDDNDTPGTNIDKIQLGAGITPDDVTLRREDDDLFIKINGTSDSLRVVYYFYDYDNSYKVDQITFADGTSWYLETVKAKVMQPSDGDDWLYGSDTDDSIFGGSGNDRIYGDSGNDTLDGGTGNDTLFGGDGADTYIFNLGSGRDAINNFNWDAAGTNRDKVQLGAGMTQENITLRREWYDLIIEVNGTSDSLRLFNYFHPSCYRFRVDQIAFADGASWDGETIKAKVMLPTAGDDWLYGSDADDRLFGGAGNDYLYGGSCNVTLDGGVGNDYLEGGAGADTYIFGRGYGHDTISGENIDKIQLGEGITQEDVTLWRESNDDLVININGTSDTLRVSSYFYQNASSGCQIDQINFADGSSCDVATVKTKMIAGVPASANDLLIGGLSNENIFGGDGNDTLYGGIGNDTMDGGIGNDTFVFNIGDGVDMILDTSSVNEGNRILFGEGITVSDLTFVLDQNLTINMGNNGDAIILRSFDQNENYWILEFVDGTQTKLADFLNRPPFVVDLLSDQTTSANAAFNFTLPVNTFADPDVGDALTCSATLSDDTALPSWLSFDPATLTFSGTPTNDNVGVLSVKVRAIDKAGESGAACDFNVTVINAVNHAPVVVNSLADQTTMEDAVFSFTVPVNTFADVDLGDTLTYSATLSAGTALPTWLAFDSATLTFTGTPTNDNVGVLSLKVTATDTAGAGISDDFDVNVANVNDVPVVVNPLADQTTMEDGVFSFTIPGNTFADVDAGDALTYSATLSDGTTIPSWLAFDAATMTFSGIPAGTGIISIKATATDTSAANVSSTFNIDVQTSVIMGAANDDNLIGTIHNNIIYGFGGNDTIDGGTGADSMLGGTGDDTYFVDSADDIITENANEGIDKVQSSISYTLGTNIENLALTGHAAINGTGNVLDNILAGNGAVNTLAGGAGNDTLNGGSGADYLRGEAGDDVLEAYADGTWVSAFGTHNVGSPGNPGTGQIIVLSDQSRIFDIFDGGAGFDTLVGTAGNDVFFLDDAYSPFPDNAGPRIRNVEVIDGGEGNDIIDLTSMVYNYGNVSLRGGEGNDILWSSSGNDSIQGDAGDDQLWGGAGNDTLNGGNGNDTLNGGNDADTMIGGIGNDIFVVDNTVDVVTENVNEGTDTAKSSITYTLCDNVENLILTGTATIDGKGNELNNSLTGNSAANTLTGDAGNDTLNGGTGADTMIGGLGNDTYYVDNTGDVVMENANEGTDIVQSSITYALGANVEKLTLTGTSAGNGAGNELDNTLTGNSAANTLTGGAGNDTLNGGTGADNMIGGLGDDTYVVDNISDVVTESANEGTDTVQSKVTYILSANVENLTLTGSTAISATGNALDNILTGNTAANTLTGGAGNDTLSGGTGADNMIGGLGDDTYIRDNTCDVVTENANEGTDTVQSSVTYTLGSNVENLTLTGTSKINGTGNTLDNKMSGNAANNALTGNAGNDILDGGSGNDILTGGVGSDMYLFRRTDGRDTLNETAGVSGDKDTLKLTEGITTTGPVIVKQNNDLYVFINSDNYIKIVSEFQQTNYGIERLEVTDGHYITRADIQTIVDTMSFINNNTGMDVMQKYNAMLADQQYQITLAQSWQQ